MFINDLMITIPQYYANTWGKEVFQKLTKEIIFWEVEIKYQSPRENNKTKFSFNARLSHYSLLRIEVKLVAIDSNGIINLQYN